MPSYASLSLGCQLNPCAVSRPLDQEILADQYAWSSDCLLIASCALLYSDKALERWLSGRKRQSRKLVYRLSVSRVRIPPSPPDQPDSLGAAVADLRGPGRDGALGRRGAGVADRARLESVNTG